MEKVKKIEEVNAYILAAKAGVNGKYRQKYHMMPPVGWMNDPNGLVYTGGRYHLYYQFNPYAAEPGTMYWGHLISPDLITYRDGGVAIAPQEENVSIYSGGAIAENGEIRAVYTEHYERGETQREEVYGSVSRGGAVFTGRKKLFGNESLPPHISRTDFRDPCPVRIGEEYFVFVGGKDLIKNEGVIVVLGGRSLEGLSYRFCIGPFYELGDMCECPSYCRMGEKDVFVVSGCNVPPRGVHFQNVNSSVFVVGKIDFTKGTMAVEHICEIDQGDAFYAPQLVSGADEPVMIGWQEMWKKRYPTQELGHGWAGAFSIPRALSLEGSRVLQTPVRSLEKYEKEYRGAGVPKCADLLLSFDGAGEAEIAAENGSVRIGADGGIFLDTRLSNNANGCVRRTEGAYGRCTVRVLLDVSGIELFIEGGREAISSRIYLDGAYTLRLNGGAKLVSCKEIAP